MTQRLKFEEGAVSPVDISRFFAEYPIPDYVKAIAQTLAEQGFACWLVGGCVRDAILGRNISDWDLCTTALPSEVVKSFPRTLDIGAKYGTITVVQSDPANSHSYVNVEVTTLRTDGGSSDQRHPDSVAFTNSIVEDLSRRDFTINAMAVTLDGGFELVDPFHGIWDIGGYQSIRCVGNAEDRFAEDGLRVLRAIRFVSLLTSPRLEDKTRQALMNYNKSKLSQLSAERIRSELLKTLKGINVDTALDLLRDMKIMEHVLPSLSSENSYPHIFESVKQKLKFLYGYQENSDYSNLQLASIFYKTQEQDSYLWQTDLARLHLSKADTNHIKTLVDKARTVPRLDNMVMWGGVEYRRWASQVGRENTEYVLLVAVDNQPDTFSPIHFEQVKLNLEFAIEGRALTVGELNIDGASVMECLGLSKPSAEVGVCLRKLLEVVLESPSLNTKKALTNLVMRRPR